MRGKWWLLLWFWLLLFHGLYPAWGQGLDFRVYCRGEEAKLTLKTEGGRVYGLETELIKLMDKLFPGLHPSGVGEDSWLSLRRFWEDLGFEVKWVPEVKAIIIRSEGNGVMLPEEARQIIAEALADTRWLNLNSKEELCLHLRRFYTPALVEEMLDDAWQFIQWETDWHGVYQLVDCQGLDGGEDWLLVQVTVKETVAPSEEPVYFRGIVKLEKLDVGWRIAAQEYFE